MLSIWISCKAVGSQDVGNPIPTDSHFSGRSFGTLLTRGRVLSRVLCVVLGVFQPPCRMRCHLESLCPGGGGGEPGTKEGTFGDVQPDGVSQFKESMHFNAFQCISMHFNAFQCISCRLGWKDFDV